MNNLKCYEDDDEGYSLDKSVLYYLYIFQFLYNGLTAVVLKDI